MADPWEISHRFVTLGKVIGRGAYGAVRAGTYRSSAIAAKSIHPIIAEGYASSSFLREIAILQSLRHPNVLLFIGITDHEPHQLITEMMDSHLLHVIEETQLPVGVICHIFAQILQGLEYLHTKFPEPVLHRDISSKNILLKGDQVKIADLGQAKNMSTAQQDTPAAGAAVYAAPETFPFDARYTGTFLPSADIFSVGILLCQMITQQYPEQTREQRAAQITAACEQQPVLRGLIQACVQKEQQLRPTATQALQMLLQAVPRQQHLSLSESRLHHERQLLIQERDIARQELGRLSTQLQQQQDRLSLERGEAEQAMRNAQQKHQATQQLLRQQQLAQLQQELVLRDQYQRELQQERDRAHGQLQELNLRTQERDTAQQQVEQLNIQLQEQQEQLTRDEEAMRNVQQQHQVSQQQLQTQLQQDLTLRDQYQQQLQQERDRDMLLQEYKLRTQEWDTIQQQLSRERAETERMTQTVPREHEAAQQQLQTELQRETARQEPLEDQQQPSTRDQEQQRLFIRLEQRRQAARQAKWREQSVVGQLEEKLSAVTKEKDQLANLVRTLIWDNQRQSKSH
eukprot:TRINITY_DN5462_c1_g1_i1.p1 TRINITY_DN5462_c1_g1~~TRINITY_DN5462_c1_g1_i1.p1  ORF type:complete len:572 (-),score=129.71 TRINITY_DN5462_c1_g1_i1:690-2405(-)